MKIVGISACPAGLAHTPMAAKALEKVIYDAIGNANAKTAPFS